MIQYIEVEGVKRPFHFSFSCIARFADTKGVTNNTLDEFAQNLTLSDFITIAYLGFEKGARREKQEIKITQEMVEEWIDDDTQVVKEVMKLFAAEMGAFSAAGGVDEEPGEAIVVQG